MKKFLLILGFFVVGSWANAQSYSEKDFQQSVLQINTAKTKSDYDNLFQKFSKFTGNKTSERWEAYYYAAVSMYLKIEGQLNQTVHEDLPGGNAVARKFAKGALNSQQDNAEANILLGLIYFQKMQINGSQDPQDMEVITKSIAKAEAASPNNLRLAILKARLKEKSGDKANAEKLLQKAASGFDSKNSTGKPSPTWGRQLIQVKN
ncbi:tetratricopeptide repeat protein [Chryseobacterium paridis]|uniref:Tetratricopeptide repeat protein n=1 Tax=Chryseobacterium paridis TaxID=2800328 RepID=A0ABS1FQC4_9FLAO|nr:hypothetical protein [Chryseobacterium paridis]MBK1894454.1 hypothetical protein [Chryseobacterium paridis]